MGYSKTCPKVLNTGLRDNINDGSLLSKLKTLIYSSLSAEPTLLFDIKILCLCLFDGISKPNNNSHVINVQKMTRRNSFHFPSEITSLSSNSYLTEQASLLKMLVSE